MSDLLKRKLAARRRARAKPPVRLPGPPKEVARGWYLCCGAFYVGFGWQNPPPCPRCDKKSKPATWAEVGEQYGWRQEQAEMEAPSASSEGEGGGPKEAEEAKTKW